MQRNGVRLLGAAALVGLTLSAAPRGSVSAQTTGATPTPTLTPTSTATPTVSPTLTASPTPTTTPPTAKQLLAGIAPALKAQNTVHISEKDVTSFTAKGKLRQFTSTEVGDISINPAKESYHVVLPNGSAHTQGPSTFDVVLIGNKEATKSSGRAWNCNISTPAFNPNTFTAGAKKVKLIDTMTISGVAVWHVHAQVHTSASSKVLLPVDYYISQADGTLVRLTAALTQTIQKIPTHISLVGNLSRYGERVHIAFPKACTK